MANGSISNDPQQRNALQPLERLYKDLTTPQHKRLFGSGARRETPRGVYLYGAVGRGKSMLMDLFYDGLPADLPKQRVHFHAFMIDVQQALNQARLANRAERGLPDYAKVIAGKVRLLCFDEFHVTDVADAMILSRLFTALFDEGVAVVSTSNWEPDRLYEGGLQRDRFLLFIDLIKTRMDVVPLTQGVDYRLKALTDTGVYLTPLGEGTRRRADALFATLTDGVTPQAQELSVRGHAFVVPQAVKSVARFSFAQLCERPLGAEDYLVLASHYHTVFIEGIPKLTYDRRNETKRLMTLIDMLYDKHIHVVITADAPADQLYRGQDYVFEFQRTVSRLIEMQGEAWLSAKKDFTAETAEEMQRKKL